jgi:hypothetical protein
MPGTRDASPMLVPIDELLEIVTEAGLLHQRDFYETSLTNLVVKGGDPLGDLSTAAELAASLGIPEERLRAVIASRYPSAEDQIAALETQGAVATPRAVARTYQSELLRVLRQALPSRNFEAKLDKSGRLYDQPYLETKWRRDYTIVFSLVKEPQIEIKVQRTWRDWFRNQNNQQVVEAPRDEVFLATIQVGNEFLRSGARLHRGQRLHFVVTVGSGVFVNLCNDKLSELRDRFEKHNGIAAHEVVYDYVVQETDQLG